VEIKIIPVSQSSSCTCSSKLKINKRKASNQSIITPYFMRKKIGGRNLTNSCPALAAGHASHGAIGSGAHPPGDPRWADDSLWAEEVGWGGGADGRLSQPPPPTQGRSGGAGRGLYQLFQRHTMGGGGRLVGTDGEVAVWLRLKPWRWSPALGTEGKKSAGANNNRQTDRLRSLGMGCRGQRGGKQQAGSLLASWLDTLKGRRWGTVGLNQGPHFEPTPPNPTQTFASNHTARNMPTPTNPLNHPATHTHLWETL